MIAYSTIREAVPLRRINDHVRDDEMTALRCKQANFVGPAGYISMEDGEAIELVQRAVEQAPDKASVIDLGGKETANEENLLTESMVRSFWSGYRDMMGFGR